MAIVRVEETLPLVLSATLTGLRLVDGPDGIMVEDSDTVPENPPRLARVTVAVADEPMLTASDVGLAEMVKSSAVTETEIVTEWDSEPLVPVTTIV